MFRDEDIDPQRCRPEFADAALADLRWAGLDWDEGPDIGGPHAPYRQSARVREHRRALVQLRAGGWVFPCTCSRRDVVAAAGAPHDDGAEPIYPGTCRCGSAPPVDAPYCWRFRVPDGQEISFVDGRLGAQRFLAGQDFGDFVVWRRDDAPAYELAVVVDDAAMEITEVVRGEDLLVSTARQLLLYGALGRAPPAWYHCPLVLDHDGRRLAKRHRALSLHELRAAGHSPHQLPALATTVQPGRTSGMPPSPTKPGGGT